MRNSGACKTDLNRQVANSDGKFSIRQIHPSSVPPRPSAGEEYFAVTAKRSVFVKMIGAGHGGFKQPETQERAKAFIGKYLRDEKVEVSDKPINCKR